MILFKNGSEMAVWALRERAAGRQIGFVPTMGALHQGHISLIEASKTTTPLTVCSIFVNPTQFNDPADFQKYPITIEKDIYLLEQAGVDALFLPEVAEMYPGGVEDLEQYALGRLETLWEGKFRPGHFQGVCQVVRRLLDRVQPHHLFMGQKDYQQCLVIRRLLELTGSSTLLHTCPIQREPDGLAMSSRNQRLTAAQREEAPSIHQALSWLAAHWREGIIETSLAHARGILEEQGLRPDYIAIADRESLEPLQAPGAAGGAYASSDPSGVTGSGETDGSSGSSKAGGSRGAVVLAAAYLGEVRLIDNILLDLP